MSFAHSGIHCQKVEIMQITYWMHVNLSTQEITFEGFRHFCNSFEQQNHKHLMQKQGYQD